MQAKQTIMAANTSMSVQTINAKDNKKLQENTHTQIHIHRFVCSCVRGFSGTLNGSLCAFV